MPLTAREREYVAELAHDGATNRQIAQRLFVAEQTVKFNLSNAMYVAGVATRTALALWWIRGGQYEQPRPRARSRRVERAR